MLATVLGILGIVVGITLLFGSFTLIGSGERGVITHFGSVQSTILGEGFNFKMPIRDSIKKMDVRTHVIQFDNANRDGDDTENSSLFAASKDLQDVQIAIVVNYHVDPAKVNTIFQQYGYVEDYEVNVLKPLVREIIKSQASSYTAEELVTKRAEFSNKVSAVLADAFTSKSAIFERVNITNFQFSESFNKAIEAKVTAEQNALAARNKLEQVKFEAEQRVAQAKAEAEAIRIQSEAIQQSGGANYVNLKYVEKWDGKLPVYNLGSSSPLIQIPSAAK